jgi:hypothetical protein
VTAAATVPAAECLRFLPAKACAAAAFATTSPGTAVWAGAGCCGCRTLLFALVTLQAGLAGSVFGAANAGAGAAAAAGSFDWVGDLPAARVWGWGPPARFFPPAPFFLATVRMGCCLSFSFSFFDLAFLVGLAGFLGCGCGCALLPFPAPVRQQ